jgi:hypothetical protein
MSIRNLVMLKGYENCIQQELTGQHPELGQTAVMGMLQLKQ